MKIERNTSNQFSLCFSSYSHYGFHATSSLASSEIEKVGILPNKIFDPSDHQTIASEAIALGIDVSSYQQWLQMRSITFAKNQANALAHVTQGSSGGQGLGTMLTVLNAISSQGNAAQINMVQSFINQIQNIRTASSVIYAVDLSSLGNRLVLDPNQSGLYQVYFDPNAPLPKVSIVSPSYLIVRLDVI
jgi:hypothetical protein